MAIEQPPVKPPSNPSPALDSIQYYLDGFLLKHRSQRHSPRTIEYYRENLKPFIWFLEQQGYPTTLANITPNHIRHFLIYLQEEKEGRWGLKEQRTLKPLSPSTIHIFARCLRAFFRWATREAHLPYNPFSNVDMPKLPDAWKVQTFTDAEIVAMFAAIDKAGRPFTIQRNRAILALLLDTGIRASELLSLETGSINPHESLFTVRGKGDKTRPVVVGSFARKELWAYLTHYRLKLDTSSQALFVSSAGTPLTYSGLQGMFHSLKKLTGIDRVSLRPHICRHTFATKAHRNGMRGSTLQEVLGHTQFDTTRRYYLDISKEDLVAEHAQFGPLDNMSRQLKDTPLVKAGSTSSALPPADVLLREVKQSNYRAVARKYGVSDTTVRNHLKRAELIL